MLPNFCKLCSNNYSFMMYRCSPDGVFEMISMCINVALWFTKHGAKMAAKEE